MSVPLAATEPARPVSAEGVPAYDVLTLRPRAHAYCVCVFVINEGERIRAQLRAMQPLGRIVDIIVADGGLCLAI